MKDINEILAKYALGTATTEDMVAAGLLALDLGFSSDEVLELAGSTSPLYRREVEPLFVTVIAQMNKSVPSSEDAALFMANICAHKIISGEITPAVGVAEMDNLWCEAEHPASLGSFYAHHEELLDALIGKDFSSDELKLEKEQRIRLINEQIVKSAREFIASRNENRSAS